jgi:hypothetical protein
MTTIASGEPLRQVMRVTDWGGFEGTQDLLSVPELTLLRNACAAIAERLQLGALELVASSDASASMFLLESPLGAVVLAGSPELEKLGDRLPAVDAWRARIEVVR